MTTETLTWSKTLQRERQISTSSCLWGRRWSLPQKRLIEGKTCPHCWYQQCPMTWMNNSNCFTGGLTLWIALTQNFVWFCSVTMWTTQRFICWSPIDCKEDGRQELSTSCLCEWKYYYEKFINLLDVMNFVYYETFTNKPIWNVH